MTIINTTNGGGAKVIAGEEKPASFPSEYPAPEGYDGWSKLTIEAPDNLVSSNIKTGVSIAGVPGSYETPTMSKIVTPTQFPTTVYPLAGYHLGQVTVEAPSNLSEENIKKDVEIAGVTGTYEPALTTQEGTITEFPMTYATPEGFYGMSTVIAHAPETLVADNIKKGVEVANITGTYEPALQSKSTKATSFPVTVEPDSDYYGLEQASVTAPDNLTAENIKKDVTIAGVTGTYKGDTTLIAKIIERTLTELTADDLADVTKIGDYSFYHARTLTSVFIPGNVLSLGQYCFASTTFSSVVFSAGLMEIGVDAFFSANITAVDLPDTVKTIGNNCFAYCYYLTSANIPGSVTQLGSGVFSSCILLESVVISDGITTLPSSTFNNCPKLQFINIPDSVTTLGSDCFTACKSLNSIILPNNLSTLGASCFSGCNGLTTIKLPGQITEIPNYCFQSCFALSSIEIPDNVTFLGSSCFYYAGLESVTIPLKVTGMSYKCFYYCSKLASVTMLPTIPPTLGGDAFASTSSDLVITVPKGTLDAYKAATNWSAYADKMVEASE